MGIWDPRVNGLAWALLPVRSAQIWWAVGWEERGIGTAAAWSGMEAWRFGMGEDFRFWEGRGEMSH